MMGFEEIRAAVEGKAAQWSGAPITWDNVPQSVAVKTAIAAGTPWARLTILHGDSFTSSVGGKPCVRRTGLIELQIFTDEGVGTRPGFVLADSWADHIQYWQKGHIETLAASAHRSNPSNGWQMMLISTPFRAG